MTVVVAASARSSPGTTTSLLAMAAAWPRDRSVVLVEADPAGGVLACHHGLWGEPSLVTLAAESRAGVTAERLWAHSQPLGGLGVRVVAAPVDPRQSAAAVAALARAGLGLPLGGGSAIDVLVDAGRLDASSPATPMLEGAEVALLVARPTLVEAAHWRERVGAVSRHAAGPPELVVVGDGRWGPEELSSALSAPLAAVFPHDPRAAAALIGSGPKRGLTRTPLLRAAAGLAKRLSGASGSPPAEAPSGVAPLATERRATA